MSAILDFYMYQYETNMNGFLDLEYHNVDTICGFLGSVEAEIITFLPNKTAILIILHPSYKFSEVAPHKKKDK